MAKLRGSHQGNKDVSRLRDETDRALRKVDSDKFLMPIGSIVCYGGSEAPKGWLICDGSDVARDKFSELFNVIGVSFGGGDGATTFTLPDFKGNSPVGKKTLDSIGDTLGSDTHTHDLSSDGWALASLGGSPNVIAIRRKTVSSWTETHTASVTVSSSGSSRTTATELGGATDSADSYHPSLIVHFIIYAGTDATPV